MASREFTTVECYINESNVNEIGHVESVTTNCEIVANHLTFMRKVAMAIYGSYKKI